MPLKTISLTNAQDKYATLERRILDKQNIYLYGDSKTGKTHFIEQIRTDHPELQFCVFEYSNRDIFNMTQPYTGGLKAITTPFIVMYNSLNDIGDIPIDAILEFTGVWNTNTL